MDKELLAAIGDMLDKKFDEKLEPIKQDITGLHKQNDKISIAVINNSHGIHQLIEGQAKLSEGLFQLQSQIGELHRGQDSIETRLDKVEAGVEVAGQMYRDHEKRIQVLEEKITA